MIVIKEINSLDNEDLIDLYTDVVRVNHYDPCETPQFAKNLQAASITQSDLRNMILSRMNND